MYNTAISRGNVRVLRSAFWHMIKLRKVKILSDKLTEIGCYAFAACNELEEVNIPEGITRIGDHAFWWSLCLRKVELPSTLTRIEDFAFDSDPLDSIDIPAGVTFIGRNAFWNNPKLKKVYSRPVVPPTTSEWSDSKPHLPFHYSSTETAILYVPKGSAEAYRASEVFSEFQNIVELEEWQWPTAINRPAAPQAQFKVYGEAGTLHVVADGNGGNGAASVNVFGIDGASVWSGQVTGRLEISLPKGFYMVRVGKTIRKVSL
ncbi:MAG: leucine-rich repeat domain-containing protein [Prevotella sp.]|nr:leucine-rich repeat domain-containing protein [Prevotella sp.]